jgi:menaquinone-dependent protoporphyrinogen IX oxidase
MKIWIVYDSKFGNNKKIAEALAEQLKNGNDVQVRYAKEITPKQVMENGIDVFLFGGPLRAGNISFTMKRWANTLSKLLFKNQKKVIKAAVWGSHSTNSLDIPPQFSWEASKLKWKAILDAFPAEKKLSDVTGFDVIPTTLKGPLEVGWEKKVLQFAEKVKEL